MTRLLSRLPRVPARVTPSRVVVFMVIPLGIRAVLYTVAAVDAAAFAYRLTRKR